METIVEPINAKENVLSKFNEDKIFKEIQRLVTTLNISLTDYLENKPHDLWWIEYRAKSFLELIREKIKEVEEKNESVL